MKVKPIVTIALGVFAVLVFFIMAVGLFVPRDLLNSLSINSNRSSYDATTPTPTPTPTAVCGSGGACTVAKDITPYSSQSDCRIAINSGVSGQPSMAIYKIPSSFLSTHAAEKSISRYCGQTLNMDLKSAVGKHSNGSSLGGSTYDQWIKNFYFASL